MTRQPASFERQGLDASRGRDPVSHRAPQERSLTEMMLLSDWRWFVPETLGLIGVIVLCRAVLPTETTPIAALPHPFWIPVVLMSCQYGIMGGIFASLVSSATFLLPDLPAQSAAEDFYAYAGRAMAQPSAWFAAALLLGSLRSLHIHQQNAIGERLDHAMDAWVDLAAAFKGAVGEIERLESRIATDAATLGSVLDSLARVDLSDRNTVLSTMAEVIQQAVGATSFAVYLESGHQLQPCLVVEDGAPVSPSRKAALSLALLHEEFAAAALPLRGLVGGDREAQPCGVVVCHRLLPDQELEVAAWRLREVCRVLAILLAARPQVEPEPRQVGEQ